MSDQFTRWICVKCGGDGIDSWNKALFDGLHHGSELPDPHMLGDNCHRCGWPVVLRYTTPGVPPRAIFGPARGGLLAYRYEGKAFQLLTEQPGAGIELAAAATRDADWSGGCLSVRAQLQ